MKRKIRQGTFETNSSSMHSLAILGKAEDELEKSILRKDEDGYLYARPGEYGWGYEVLETQQGKLNYIITSIVCSKNIDTMEELEADYDFMRISDTVCTYAGAKGIKVEEFDGDCYIDHQSNNGPWKFIGDKVETWDEMNGEWIEDFEADTLNVIFNPNLGIIIGSDDSYY